MKARAISSDKVKSPPPQTWSNAKVVGNQFFVSGTTAHDQAGKVEGDGSMYDQAKRTFQKIRHLVEAAGGRMDDIVDLTIFVTDIKRREEVWRARREFFSGDYPCSTLVEVSALAIPGLSVEIKATGFLNSSDAPT